MQEAIIKFCLRCKETRNVSCFGNYKGCLRNVCKICRKEEYKRNKENVLLKAKQRYNKNKKRFCEKAKEYRDRNKEKIEKREKTYREKNKEKILQRKRDYYQRNKNRILDYCKERNKSTDIKMEKKKYDQVRRQKPEVKERINFLYREKRKNDPTFKLMSNVACRINKELREKQFCKSGSIWKVLSYSPEQLVSHIEKQFKPGMNWENHGTYWHIDHIIPQSLLKYDSLVHPNFLKCWALENLRPLEAKENLRKGSKIEQETILDNEILLGIIKDLRMIQNHG